jgi:hypothetical protein
MSTPLARNAEVAPVVGSGGVCVSQESGSGGLLCWRFWQKSGFSRGEDVFEFNLFYKDILYIL